MRSARGEWEETFQPTRLLKPWGEGAPLSATYVALEKVLGLPTGVGTLITTILTQL
jgi:hypothetical protein